MAWSGYNLVSNDSWWSCRVTLNINQADRGHWNANWEIRNALVSGLGKYIAQPDIRVEEMRLYHADGVHLSEEGMDLFSYRLAVRVEVGSGPLSGGINFAYEKFHVKS